MKFVVLPTNSRPRRARRGVTTSILGLMLAHERPHLETGALVGAIACLDFQYGAAWGVRVES